MRMTPDVAQRLAEYLEGVGHCPGCSNAGDHGPRCPFDVRFSELFMWLLHPPEERRVPGRMSSAAFAFITRIEQLRKDDT